MQKYTYRVTNDRKNRQDKVNNKLFIKLRRSNLPEVKNMCPQHLLVETGDVQKQTTNEKTSYRLDYRRIIKADIKRLKT